jgi:hypothetical protein
VLVGVAPRRSPANYHVISEQELEQDAPEDHGVPPGVSSGAAL